MITQRECLDPKGITAIQWVLNQNETARKILEAFPENTRDALSAIVRAEWFIMSWKLGFDVRVNQHLVTRSYDEQEDLITRWSFIGCTDDLDDFEWTV